MASEKNWQIIYQRIFNEIDQKTKEYYNYSANFEQLKKKLDEFNKENISSGNNKTSMSIEKENLIKELFLLEKKMEVILYLEKDEEYSKKYSCSLTPIKRAMGELQQKSYIDRGAGRLSRILPIKTMTYFNRYIDDGSSLSEHAIKDTVKITNIILEFHLDDVKNVSNIPSEFREIVLRMKEFPFYKLKRLRLFNGEPKVIQSAWFNDFANIFPQNLLEYLDFNEKSLLQYYKENNYEIDKRDVMLTAVHPDRDEALKLNIPDNTPLLKSYQLTYAKHPKIGEQIIPLEYLESIYKDWKYKFQR